MVGVEVLLLLLLVASLGWAEVVAGWVCPWVVIGGGGDVWVVVGHDEVVVVAVGWEDYIVSRERCLE